MWPHPSTALIVLLLLQGKCWIHEVSPPRLHLHLLLLLFLLWWNDDFTDDCTDRSDRNDLPDHMTPTSAATYSVGWTSDWATWPYSTAGPTFLWFWWSMSHLSGQRSAFQFAERPKKKIPSVGSDVFDLSFFFQISFSLIFSLILVRERVQGFFFSPLYSDWTSVFSVMSAPPTVLHIKINRSKIPPPGWEQTSLDLCVLLTGILSV